MIPEPAIKDKVEEGSFCDPHVSPRYAWLGSRGWFDLVLAGLEWVQWFHTTLPRLKWPAEMLSGELEASRFSPSRDRKMDYLRRNIFFSTYTQEAIEI